MGRVASNSRNHTSLSILSQMALTRATRTYRQQILQELLVSFQQLVAGNIRVEGK